MSQWWDITSQRWQCLSNLSWLGLLQIPSKSLMISVNPLLQSASFWCARFLVHRSTHLLNQGRTLFNEREEFSSRPVEWVPKGSRVWGIARSQLSRRAGLVPWCLRFGIKALNDILRNGSRQSFERSVVPHNANGYVTDRTMREC